MDRPRSAIEDRLAELAELDYCCPRCSRNCSPDATDQVNEAYELGLSEGRKTAEKEKIAYEIVRSGGI